MRVLYFIQTYRNLPQITRLVRTIKQSSPASPILISHNSESFTIDPATFQDLADVYVTYVSNMARGDFSLMRAYLDGIAWLRAQGIHYDWITNLTGQCYPTRPLAQFEQMLAASDYDGFMQYYEAYVPSEQNPWDWREVSGRYEYQYRWRLTTTDLPTNVRRALSIPRRIINDVQPFFHIDTSYGLQFGVHSQTRPFHDRFRLYGGNTFKTLSRSAADHLYDFTLRYQDITSYFYHTLLPEEVMPQTVLLNNPQFHISSDNLYFINWEGTRLGRPKNLTTRDYDRIVAKGSFFARKFDLDQDSHILDLLDARIFGKTREPIIVV